MTSTCSTNQLTCTTVSPCSNVNSNGCRYHKLICVLELSFSRRYGIWLRHVLFPTLQDSKALYTLRRPPCRYKKTAVVIKSKKFVKDDRVQLADKVVKQGRPELSVYLTDDYVPQPHSVVDCTRMHQEAAQPAMTNRLHTQLYADLDLDFSTKKKTKFMANINGILMFPHQFEHGQTKTYLVFSESDENTQLVSGLPGSMGGGEDLIQQMVQGLIHKDDLEAIDFVFSSPQLSTKLTAIRQQIRDKMPSIKNGRISGDMPALFQEYSAGVKYKSYKISDGVGRLQIPIGQLHQDVENLEENFRYMTDTLSALKPNNLAPLLKYTTLISPPSPERFHVKLHQYVKGLDVEHEVEEDKPAVDSDDEGERASR